MIIYCKSKASFYPEVFLACCLSVNRAIIIIKHQCLVTSFTVGLDMPICNNNKAISVKSHFLRCSGVDAQESHANTEDKWRNKHAKKDKYT